MKRAMLLGAGLLAGIILGFAVHPVLFAPSIAPVFSPEEGARVISFIDGAGKTIDVEVYVFSSRDVVEALERAKARGVDVRIIVERDVISGENDQIYRELASKGFNIRYANDSEFKLTHAKFIIVDGREVLVGSHNLSNSALFKNREASVIIRDGPTVSEFARVFDNDWALAS
jgi:phosphatidylserine/phosphatidylglycerophosphate/cardiolipin synthase-like enzyme